jgi:hypothetical protein
MDRVPAANQQDRDDKSRYKFCDEMVHGNGSFGQATPFSSRPIKVKNGKQTIQTHAMTIFGTQ